MYGEVCVYGGGGGLLLWLLLWLFCPGTPYLHQSLNSLWGTTDDFTTSFLHFSLFSTALWVLTNSRFKISIDFHLDRIISAAEPFVTKLCMAMHYLIMGQSVMQEDWFTILKVKVTLSAHIIRYGCFYHIYWTTAVFAAKFNWIVHHILEYLNWIVVFKVKVAVTVKVQIFIGFLSIWPLGNQTRCVDVLLLINKPSTTKWTWTD